MAAPRHAAPPTTSPNASAVSGVARAALMAAAPTVLAALRGKRGRALISALGGATAERFPAQLLGAAGPRRHPMAPAALRIERSRARGEEDGDQVAVTVWFGDGPSLPGASGGHQQVRRVAVRLGASLLAAAAVAAATTAAGRLAEQQERPRIVEAPGTPWRPAGTGPA